VQRCGRSPCIIVPSDPSRLPSPPGWRRNCDGSRTCRSRCSVEASANCASRSTDRTPTTADACGTRARARCSGRYGSDSRRSIQLERVSPHSRLDVSQRGREFARRNQAHSCQRVPLDHPRQVSPETLRILAVLLKPQAWTTCAFANANRRLHRLRLRLRPHRRRPSCRLPTSSHRRYWPRGRRRWQ